MFLDLLIRGLKLAKDNPEEIVKFLQWALDFLKKDPQLLVGLVNLAIKWAESRDGKTPS